jgi:hypothetical protein
MYISCNFSYKEKRLLENRREIHLSVQISTKIVFSVLLGEKNLLAFYPQQNYSCHPAYSKFLPAGPLGDTDEKG